MKMQDLEGRKVKLSRATIDYNPAFCGIFLIFGPEYPAWALTPLGFVS